jgi:hypothetical protein
MFSANRWEAAQSIKDLLESGVDVVLACGTWLEAFARQRSSLGSLNDLGQRGSLQRAGTRATRRRPGARPSKKLLPYGRRAE